MSVEITIIIGIICAICGYCIGKKNETLNKRDETMQIQIDGYQPKGCDVLGDPPTGSTIQSDD